MRTYSHLFICMSFWLIQITLNAQTNQWMWVKGSNSIDQLTTYGTLGTPNAANVPGARSGAVTWTDANGDFWLFGGQGYAGSGSYGLLNDLWKYDPQNNTWTWIHGNNTTNVAGSYGTQGIPGSSNKPGGRYAARGCVDDDGNLWLFGGAGYGTGSVVGSLNDLWKYNIATNQWTWLHGSSSISQNGIYGTQGTASSNNTPGGRNEFALWYDAGFIWVFGGYGYAASTGPFRLSDLWKYNINTNQWTWVTGSTTTNSTGIYGTQGVASASNAPGARYFSQYWNDTTDHVLYLFGGYGYGTSSSLNHLNDLWSYNIGMGQWTWLRGSTTINTPGVYGAMGVPSSANDPGARQEAATWFDQGNLWMLGGFGHAIGSTAGELNDLWQYNSATNQWTWISGTNTLNQYASYGTQGAFSATNYPGARDRAATWIDENQALWLFGGFGYTTSANTGFLSDLWTYTTPCSIQGINTSILVISELLCEYDTNGVLYSSASGGTAPYSYFWSTGDSLAACGNLGEGTYSVTVTDNNGCTGTADFSLIALSHLQASIDTIINVTCEGGSDGHASVMAIGGAMTYAYSWSNGNSGPQATSLIEGLVAVTVTDANSCMDMDSGTVGFLYALPDVDLGPDINVTDSTVTLSPTLNFEGYEWSTGDTTGSITVEANGTYWLIATDANGCSNSDTIDVSLWPTGVQQLAGLEVLVYPNPAQGFLNIELNHPSVIRWQVVNLQGALVGHGQLAGTQEKINLGSLASGMYFLQLIGNEAAIQTRVNIQ